MVIHSAISKDATKDQARVLSSVSHIKLDVTTREEYQDLPDEFFMWRRPIHATASCSAALCRNMEE